jgi:putative membrane protein
MHISADDRARLHAATQAAEARTHARFALATIHVSDRYALYPIVYGAIIGLAVMGVLAIFWPEISLRTGFFASATAFVFLSLLFDWLPLRLLLVPKRVKHRHAHDFAHREFAARILAQADRKPGLVVFVSLGERYIELVADRAVHQLVPQTTWDAIVADFTDAARKGRVADGLVAGIDACASVLEKHYPPA